jgi:hypothetical protein
MSQVEWSEEAERELLTSPELRRALDALAFTITAHAVPHSGVDTGRLINSMGHRIDREDGRLVAYLGSGAQDGVQPVYYAAPHWAGRPDPNGRRATRPEKRKRIPHATRQAPTKPYTKAMQELGVEYTVEPGGFES